MIIYISIGLFALASVLGIAILIRWLQRKDASTGVVYSHGVVAVSGLLVLVVYSIMNPDHFPAISLALFPLAAIAGLYMYFSYEHTRLNSEHRRKKRLVSVAFLHAFFAISGVTTLLVFLFTGKLANQVLALLGI